MLVAGRNVPEAERWETRTVPGRHFCTRLFDDKVWLDQSSYSSGSAQRDQVFNSGQSMSQFFCPMSNPRWCKEEEGDRITHLWQSVGNECVRWVQSRDGEFRFKSKPYKCHTIFCGVVASPCFSVSARPVSVSTASSSGAAHINMYNPGSLALFWTKTSRSIVCYGVAIFISPSAQQRRRRRRIWLAAWLLAAGRRDGDGSQTVLSSKWIWWWLNPISNCKTT